MPRVHFHSVFQPPSRLDRRVGVRLEFSNQEPHHIVKLGSKSKIPKKTPWPIPSTYPVTAQENLHHVQPATLLFKTLSHNMPYHTPIQPPISITHNHSFHSPYSYSISHMGYTRPLWAYTRVTLHSYSRLDNTPGSSPGCSRVSSRAWGLRRDYKPPSSHSLLYLSL